MTSYRTDKTSRVILSAIVAYTLGYGVARTTTLRLVGPYETGTDQSYITKTGEAPGAGWAYKVFLPAVKIEEAVRSVPTYLKGSFF